MAASLTLGLLTGCSSSHPKPTPPPNVSYSASLINVPDGTAQLSSSASGSAVTLNMWGLPAGAPVTVALRVGSCIKPSSQAIVSFDAASTGSNGTLATTLTSSTGLPSRLSAPASLMLAQGSSDVACTDMPAAGLTSLVRVYPMPSLRPAAQSTATYDAEAKSLTVRINGSAFMGGASLHVYVTRGSCRSRGILMYKLKDATTDPNGTLAYEAKATGASVAPRTGQSVVVVSTSPADVPVLCGDLATSPA